MEARYVGWTRMFSAQ